MELIGYAAWRVLQNARKAAIARRNDADAEMREPAVFKDEGKAPLTRRQDAPATAEELGGQAFAPERTRTKRSADW
ncbi:hypothetical protein D3C80_411180 [compost metagenome]